MMKFLSARFKSFSCAISGLIEFFKTEFNAWFHLLAAIAAIGAAMYFEVTQGEWGVVLLSIGVVLTAELLNTAIERLCDHVRPEIHPEIKTVKDIAAGAVLVAAIAAAIAGAIVFWPYLFS